MCSKKNEKRNWLYGLNSRFFLLGSSNPLKKPFGASCAYGNALFENRGLSA